MTITNDASFKNYLKQITVPDETNCKSVEKGAKHRWIYSNGIKYAVNPSSNQTQKIEKILSIMNKDLKNFNSQPMEEEDLNKLKDLKEMIKSKVENYKLKHTGILGQIYRFFSRIIYGDINTISKELLKHIDTLEKNYQAPIDNDKAAKDKGILDAEKEKIISQNQNNSASIVNQKKIKSDQPTQILNIPVPTEGDSKTVAQAKSIIESMQAGAESLIHNRMDFNMVQRLKEAKKEAKLLLQNESLPPTTKLAMEQVIKQYNDMVDSVEVLSILRQISKEIRKPEEKTGFIKYRPMVDRFISLLNSSLNPDPTSGYLRLYEILHDLAQANRTNKQEWKEKWTKVRQNIWNASLEASSFLKKDKKITFITGSKSSSIPSILKVEKLVPAISTKPALIPTGMLLQHNIAPLAGELDVGISDQGVNQSNLSGMKFAGLDTCIGYASAKEFGFDADAELKSIKNKKEIKYIFDLTRLKVSVLRLLLMGAKKEHYAEIQAQIKEMIRKEAADLPISPDWQDNASLVGKLCKESGSQPTGELQRGQVVGVPRSGTGPKYGIITNKYEDGSYCIVVEKNGARKHFPPDQLTIMTKESLEKEKADKGVVNLNEIEQKTMHERLKNNRDKLEDILKLFESVKPFDFTSSEMELIQDPFPIVWASISTDDSFKVQDFRHGVTGEHIVPGKAVLGSDIQFVFTNRKNVDKLQAIVKNYGVEVLSFEAAYFILGKESDKYKDLWH